MDGAVILRYGSRRIKKGIIESGGDMIDNFIDPEHIFTDTSSDAHKFIMSRKTPFQILPTLHLFESEVEARLFAYERIGSMIFAGERERNE